MGEGALIGGESWIRNRSPSLGTLSYTRNFPSIFTMPMGCLVV